MKKREEKIPGEEVMLPPPNPTSSQPVAFSLIYNGYYEWGDSN